MTEPSPEVGTLLALLETRLTAAAGDGRTGARQLRALATRVRGLAAGSRGALGPRAARLDASRPTAALPAPPPLGPALPVCRFWDAALDAAADATVPLAACLRALGPRLAWVQNPNYRQRPPDPSFLDRYGYAVIAGPAEGPPALLPDAKLALGVLLLAPGTQYPVHRHPAIEVYLPVGSDGEWWREPGPWRREPPGAVIYHEPDVPHATGAGDSPLLALYLWRGDLGTHARLSPAGGPLAGA